MGIVISSDDRVTREASIAEEDKKARDLVAAKKATEKKAEGLNKEASSDAKLLDQVFSMIANAATKAYVQESGKPFPVRVHVSHQLTGPVESNHLDILMFRVVVTVYGEDSVDIDWHVEAHYFGHYNKAENYHFARDQGRVMETLIMPLLENSLISGIGHKPFEPTNGSSKKDHPVCYYKLDHHGTITLFEPSFEFEELPA